MEVVGGGTGAHDHGQGIDGVDTYMSNVALLPVEVARDRVFGTDPEERTRGGLLR